MILLTVSEFRSNLSKYLQMAMTELVSVKTKNGVFNITPNTEIRTSNPSPTNDPWFDEPENMASIERGKEEARSGSGVPFDEFRKTLDL